MRSPVRLVTAVLVMLLVTAGVASARTKTEAADLAKQVNLTKSDMPGYKATTTDGSQLSGGKKFEKCAKTVPASQHVGYFQSKMFERDTPERYESVSSEVDVLQTPQLVQKDLAAWGRRRARNCIVEQLKREGGRRLVRVTVAPLKPAVPNGTGLRVKTIVRTSGMKVPVYLDVLLVGHEDVELALLTQAGPSPLPRDQEDALLQIAESRLEAQLQPPAPQPPAA
jgi:hypothetical protein